MDDTQEEESVASDIAFVPGDYVAQRLAAAIALLVQMNMITDEDLRKEGLEWSRTARLSIPRARPVMIRGGKEE
jgi:hypothetical protein